MPLETASTIADLVPSNPAGSDQLSSSDDHIRLIKGALKGSFPNFTSAALTSTNAQIDAAVTATTNGVSVLADAGVAFKTNTTDTITNPAAGEIDLTLAGTLAAKFLNTSGALTFTWNGNITATGGITSTTAFSGPGITPIGGMIMWLTDTLPADGTWCWANGGTLSRTGNGAALYALTGTAYGAGDGTTTFNVINMQEVVPVGKSTMGGAASPGLLTSIATSVSTVLGSLFGSDTHTQTINEMPAHTHENTLTDEGHFHTYTNWDGGSFSAGGGQGGAQDPGVHTSTSTSNITLTNVSEGGGAAFNITQPSRGVNFIIRIG